MIGLKNNINTCYMNSALQMFFNITYMNSFFVNQDFEDTTLNLIKKCCQNYHQAKPVDTAIFKTLIPEFDNTIQHDSQEFLGKLFELIDDVCAKQNLLSPCFNIETKLLHILNSKSYNNVSQKNEKFLIVDHDASLNQAYNKFISVDNIEEFYNEKEQTYTTAKKQMLVSKWSSWLIVHINKYTQLADETMNMPFTWTIHHMLENTKLIYHVVSAIIHNGTMDYGHYVSIVRKGKKYYYINDSYIKEVTKEQFKGLLNNAYLVCYKMKHSEPI